MIQVAPSTTFEATLELGVTGLVGTLKLGTYDGDTATQALSASDINEIGSSGVYVATRTSPGTAGQYVLVWSQDGTLDPDQVATEDLSVTGQAVTVGGSGNLYVTTAELKLELNIGVTTYDDRIDHIVAAVSRAIDIIQRTRYFTTSETRYYTPRDGQVVDIDDLTTLSSLTVDSVGDGSYGTAWTAGTHFTLEPVNNALENKPYRQIVLRSQSGARFPGYRNSVKIVGTFGYPELPAQINQAAVLLASRLYNRRDAPFGAIALGGLETASVVRIARADPDVMMLLESVDKKPARLVA